MKPLRDRVIVKRKESDEATASGIIITNPKKENAGTVVYVADDVIDIVVGNVVVFPTHAGQVLPGKGNEGLVVFYQAEILAVIQ